MSSNPRAFAKVLEYIHKNPVAILGTINLDGSPHGAGVYVCADEERRIVYFLTQTETKKYKNLVARNRVSLTIVNSTENSTLQADGHATTVQNPEISNMVAEKIERLHHSSNKDRLLPVAKLQAGRYVVVAIEIWHARLAQFEGMRVGDEHIFTAA